MKRRLSVVGQCFAGMCFKQIEKRKEESEGNVSNEKFTNILASVRFAVIKLNTIRRSVHEKRMGIMKLH
jgi:hypothetical protein